MRFLSRRLVMPNDLNYANALFGGRALEWIDEEAALYSVIQLENQKVVTKYMSEINFVGSAKPGDIIEIGIEVSKFGNSSIDLRCVVRNKMTYATIITIESIILVNLGENGKPAAHGKTEVEYQHNRMKNKGFDTD